MFDNLLKASIGLAITPLSLTADVFTLGGLLVEKETPFTVDVLSSVAENLNDAIKKD